MPSRRAFLAGALAVLLAPLRARGRAPAPSPQGSGSTAATYRIGILDPVSLQSNAPNMDEFRKGLRELGYVEGKNLTLAYRSADGRVERFTALAQDLAQQDIDLIVTNGTPATLAAKAAAGGKIRVVTAGVVDPVETGLAASLERPGANVTGIAVLVKELEAKRLDLLRALAPGRTRVVALMDMSNPAFVPVWKATEAAAPGFGLQAVLVDVRKPEKIAKAFDKALAQQAEALVVRFGALTQANRRLIVDLAAKYRLPAMYASRQFVDLGGLVSYGLNTPQMYYRAASFVDRILKGTSPAELAMERPSKFELVINRRTAKTLGLIVPPDLLLRSNQMVD